MQKICSLPGLVSYENFSVNYSDCGLFGIRYVTDGYDMEQALKIVSTIQRQWKHLATTITDHELDRTKNQLRTKFFAQLSDNASIAQYLASEVSSFSLFYESLFLDFRQRITDQLGYIGRECP